MSGSGGVLSPEVLEHIRRENDKAPPLSRAQLDQLAVILRPAIAQCAGRGPHRQARRTA